MIKKIAGCVLLQLVIVNSAFAISVKSKSKFYFNDRDGEQISYMECRDLSFQDNGALLKITDRAEKHEIEVESLLVKKQRISVIYVDGNGRHQFEFDSAKSSCQIEI